MSLVADAFRGAGWKVERLSRGEACDFLVRKDDVVFVVDLKMVSEMRSDRIVPLFSQAVLEARAMSQHKGAARPLIVFGSSRPAAHSVLDRVHRFAAQFAPDAAVGLVDFQGFRHFSDPALVALNAAPNGKLADLSAAHRVHGLFSDLNQWMLKVLVAPRIPEKWLSAPRGSYRNSSELAKAARVSVMSAYRFVNQLQVEGFIEPSQGHLRLVRIDELMARWQSAVSVKPSREMRARWILGGGADALGEALRKQQQAAAESPRRRPARRPARMCLGLFAAADRLGLGFVHGVAPHVYVERLDVSALRQFGLSLSEPGGPVDVLLRVPAAAESVFRAMVQVNDVPVSDVLQVWLDVHSHPARGGQQANEIRRRVFDPLFADKPR